MQKHRNLKVFFLATIGLFLRSGHGLKTFLGFTHKGKHLLFLFLFCSILSPSYLSGWVDGWVVGLI